MGVDAVRGLADQLQHLRADRAEHQRHVRGIDRPRVEEGLQAGELVVLADVLEPFAGAEGVEDGAQRAEASGYTTNERLTRNWLAAPAELAFSQDFGALGLELAATALFPLVRNEFVVDGQGIVYSAAKVSALVAIRAVGVLPW